MIPALILAFSLVTAAPAPDDGGGEPLPPGAPSDSYELGAWCYGALNEYLLIYDEVKPDLRDIDRMFGSSVVEAEPYQSDMAAARDELKLIGDAVTDAEKASPRPIAERGAAAMRQGEAIWSLAEAKPHRELARAWMLWALPDACDANARDLMTRSLILGRALSYNAGDRVQLPAPSAPRVSAAAATALDAANHAAPFIVEAPPRAAAAEAAPPPAAALPPAALPPASEPPSGPEPAASLIATQPLAPAAEAGPPPPAPAPEVVSVQPAAAPPVDVAPRPAPAAAPPPRPTAQQTQPPGPDDPQEPTL
jgi:hypothetical protein